MDKKVLSIIQASKTAQEIEKAFKTKPFRSKFKIKEKRVYSKLKQDILNSIESLDQDKWNVEYLYNLERSIILHYNDLKDYMIDFYIAYNENDEYDPKIFYSMYFVNRLKTRIISLDIISDNINFTIMDTETGNNFSISSSVEISESQHKIESFCKVILKEFFKNFLSGTPYEPPIEMDVDHK